MKTSKAGASNYSTGSKIQQQGPDGNSSETLREARADVLCELLEQREQALVLARLLSTRILEILRLPVVRTVSKPGEEPEVVFRNSRATYLAVMLMRTQRKLWETVLAPLEPELAVEARLALKSRSAACDSSTNVAHNATVAHVLHSNATKRILEILSLPAVRTIARPGEEPEEVFRNSRALYLAIRLMRAYSQLWQIVLALLAPEFVAESTLAARSRREANDAAKGVAEATAGQVQPSNATKCNVLHGNSVLCGAEAPTGDPTGKGEEQGGRKEQETKAA